MSTPSLHPIPAPNPKRRSRRQRLFLLVCSTTIAIAVLSCPITQNALSRSAPGRFSLPTRVLGSTALAHSTMIPPRSGFWHTEGSRILTGSGSAVRINGVSWSGFETTHMVPGGLTKQDYRSILRGIRAAGFNTVRIPLSNQMVEAPIVPSDIAFADAAGKSINGDLADLDSMQILDHVVDAAAQIGLKVILDNHRSEAGSSAQQSGLWYTAQYPESAWIADWTSLAVRYNGNATVIGFDLRNEPHNASQGGACWSCGGSTDWHLAAQRAGNAILRNNSNLLIFVEGTDTVGIESDFWGGNLAGVRTAPVHLSMPGRLVYSAHVYGPAEYAQSWFNVATTPASLAALYHRHWGFISENGIAPVWIGEFGTPNNDADVSSTDAGSEGQWFQALVAYLGSHPSIGWTYWGINGEDRYGLLDAAYHAIPANPLKAQALASIRQPRSAGVESGAASEPVRPANPYSVPSAFGSSIAPSGSFTAPAEAVVSYHLPPTADSRSSAHALSPSDAAVESSVAEQVRLATARALRSAGAQAD